MIIMLNQKVTILLTGLMCFSSVSGFFTVMCHGSDGHIALEPFVHNHCECSEHSERSHQDTFAGTVIGSSATHDHCTDTIAASNMLIPVRKNVRLSLNDVFTANFFLKPKSIQTTSFLRCSGARSHELYSFFVPLRTIILLT